MPKPEIAILYNQDNAILTFAMDADERVSLESHRGYHEAVWRLDTFADSVMPDDLPNLSHKVLIVPWHPIECKESFDAIDTFARNGGTVIVENAMGMIDASGIASPTVPAGGLAEAWGIEEDEALYVNNTDEFHGSSAYQPGFSVNYPGAFNMPADDIYDSAHVEFINPVSAKVRARTYVTPLKLSKNARPIATCGGHVTGAMAEVEDGRVFYLGTNIGQSIYYGDLDAIKLICAIIDPMLSPRIRGDRLRTRLIECDGEALLVVVNESREQIGESIRVPQQYVHVQNAYSGDELSIRNGMIDLSLGAVDTAVLYLLSNTRRAGVAGR
jgi:hypothetical protein